MLNGRSPKPPFGDVWAKTQEKTLFLMAKTCFENQLLHQWGLILIAHNVSSSEAIGSNLLTPIHITPWPALVGL